MAVWAQSSGPAGESDIAGNVALLFFGWVLPLFFVLIVLLFRYLLGHHERAPYINGRRARSA